jgi:hypothetical protein
MKLGKHLTEYAFLGRDFNDIDSSSVQVWFCDVRNAKEIIDWQMKLT